MPDAVEQALAGAWTAERPLVLIDTYERMSALGGYLRSTLLPSLPASAVVVVASRDAPEPGWFEGGWETVALELPLAAAVRARIARAARRATAWATTARAAAIARWAGGLPLALRLGATAARADPAWAPGPTRRRCARTCGASPRRRSTARSRDVFALACVARVVTPRWSPTCCPDVDAAAALRWLAGCAFADARPGGVDAARARPPAAARRAARAHRSASASCARGSPTACTPARSPAIWR